MEQFNIFKGITNGNCSRCGDEKPLNTYGVCAHCDDEIDQEYMDLYNNQNMEC